MRNQAKSLVKFAKIDFIKEQLEQNKEDSKKFWRNIKSIVPDCNNNNIIHLEDENKLPIPESDVANYINNFFTSIGPRLARKDISNYLYQGTDFINNFEFSKVTPQDIIQLAKEINITKSSAIDGFSSRILKDIILALPDQFTHIIISQ